MMQARPPSSARIPLYSQRSSASRVFFVVVLLLVTVVLAPLLMLVVGGLLYSAVSPRAGEIGAMVALLLCVLLMIVKLLSVTRAAAWMEGSTILVRGALKTRRCDLARASDIALRQARGSAVIPMQGGATVVPSGRRVPVLHVSGGSGGARLRLRLAEPSTTTPLQPPALNALANVIESAPQARRDPASFHEAVAGLRSMAAHPNTER